MLVQSIDDETTAAIITRCAELEPGVLRGKVDSVKVGLRPNRPAVRLEVDTNGAIPVTHNYGHGSSGVSLSWGCALEVAALVEMVVRRR